MDIPVSGVELPFPGVYDGQHRSGALSGPFTGAENANMLRTLHYGQSDDRAELESLIRRLQDGVDGGTEVADQVAVILADVRREGDDAIVKYMRLWTNPQFRADRIRVTQDEMAAAEAALDPKVREALSRSIDHVRAYQSHIAPKDPPTVTIDDAELGMRFTPIARAGLHVPGGKAAYPSSVIMLAVPAQVAGVSHLAVVSPPPTGQETDTDISPLVLGVCSMLGLERVYRIGGAQAIAALAYGTDSVEPVDFIAGPGNAYTQQAKRQLFGKIGIDGFFGPSEIVVLADASADPKRIAADLLAQAEHDPGCCYLITTDAGVAEAVNRAIDAMLPQRKRRKAIESALRDWSCAVVCPDLDSAHALVDRIAAEHVTLAVEDPHATLAKLSNGGAWFLGDGTPVASGDYYAGPSHCLPTGTTARFTSGLSAYTFLKRSSVEHYPSRPNDRAIADIALLAEAEGLDAHAESVRIRKG